MCAASGADDLGAAISKRACQLHCGQFEPSNWREAARLWQYAASEHQHVGAKARASTCYWDGLGVFIDRVKARRLAQDAAAGRDAYGAMMLAHMCLSSSYEVDNVSMASL